MVSSDKKLANVVGGKTARPCDNCIRKRACWFCAADDVFLCQSCDVLVHSENPMACRHERVRLKSASLKLPSLEKSMPSWDRGFTKKPRTPRGNNNKNTSHETPKSQESRMSFNPLCLVPEIGSDEYETATMNSEDQLLYQVPVFYPFAADICFSGNSNEGFTTPIDQPHTSTSFGGCNGSKVTLGLNNLNELMLPSDKELAEFAADVESLLGNGLDQESFDMEGLGLIDCREKGPRSSLERMKVEEDMQYEVENETEMMREPFQLSFHYDCSPEGENAEVEGGGCSVANHAIVAKEDEECEVAGDDHVNILTENHDNIHDNNMDKRLLKLNYEGIIAAWDDQRSPWTTGDRPVFHPNECWPHCTDGCGMMQHEPCQDVGMMRVNAEGGREARVLRYREKRRTRLFSKKIRYEVRKLNAEKRPRMKGRFVKRTNFAAIIT